MTSDLIQYASVAGELAPNLFGRTDFEKYDSAWARATNWIVDYRGGLFTRPGSVFGDLVEWASGEAIKAFPFQFSPDTANTYLCLFGDDYIRFIQDNAYVLEDDITIASLANDSGDRVEFTSTSHGLNDDDWVKLSDFSTNSTFNTRTLKVDNATTDTFTLVDPITGNDLEVASVSTETGTVNRIYTVASPYGQEDLERLQGVQIRDTLRLTHPDYPIKNLTRSAHTSWAIADESLGTAIGTVTGLGNFSTDASDSFTYMWMVTAVNEDGEEGLPDFGFTGSMSNLGSRGDRVNFDWTEVTGAVHYNIYRSRGHQATNVLRSDVEVGYIGRSRSPQFTDNGITPDYTKKPPRNYNPFANGRIRYAVVNTPGSGYSYNDTITWPAGGSGAYGYVVTPTGGSGGVNQIDIWDGGKDYTGTTIDVASGSGADIDAVLSPATGNNPHCAAIFQQRQVYGATDEFPLRLFGSQPGYFSNFNFSDAAQDDDSYEFDIDAEQVSPLRHLIPTRGGILVFNEIGVWLVSGRSTTTALNASNAQSEIQNDIGATYVRPVYVDATIMYAAAYGQELRMLVYDDYNKVYGGQNVSLLSNHLFDADLTIEALTYAAVPFKVVHAVQNNGRLLSLTIDNVNNVYAVTPHWTEGYYRYATAVLENNEHKLYTFTERYINGNTVMFFERQAEREFTVIEDSFCVDAGLELGKTNPSGTLVPSTLTGSVTFTVTGATPFVTGDVGKIIRCGTGRAIITGYTSSSEVDATWQRDLEEVEPETSTPKKFASGDWAMDSLVSTLSGLWHLEGQAVSVLADGEVITGKTVSSGAISLTTPASRVVVGLGFDCIARTLPPSVGDLPIESRRKRTTGLGVRIHETVGLKYGKSLDNLYEMADREKNLGWYTENRLRSEMQQNIATQGWTVDDQMYLVQNTPRPAAILSVVRDVELGDDKQ